MIRSVLTRGDGIQRNVWYTKTRHSGSGSRARASGVRMPVGRGGTAVGRNGDDQVLVRARITRALPWRWQQPRAHTHEATVPSARQAARLRLERRTRGFGELLLVAVALLISGCGASADTAPTDSPRRGGTAYLETAQEPPILNTWLASGGMAVTRTITDPLHAPWIRLDDRNRWIPVIASTVPSIANGLVQRTPDGGTTIIVPLRSEARWSDGAPITCRDLQFTWRTVMDARWQIGSRIGWEHISAVECPQPHRARITMSTPHAPFLQDILATHPLPAHQLIGADFNRAWSNRIPVSSGPFRFIAWKRGDQLVMERVPNWWGAGTTNLPYLDRIVIRFVPDAQTMKLDLRMQDTDMIGLPPDTDLPRELQSIRTARSAILPGASWEQLSLNTSAWPLRDVRVRRAIAAAIDRDAITSTVLRGQVPRLDSTLLPAQKPWYRPVFRTMSRDLEQVQQLMEAAGFTRSDSGVWNQNGRPAELTLRTTSGNPLRSKTIQLMQAQLREAGFNTTITLHRPEVFFAQYIAPGRYHLAIYAFGHGPEPTQSRIFACSEIPRPPAFVGKNNFRICDAMLDADARAADRELDPVRRERIFASMQQRVAATLPTIPLFQPPDTLAWDRRLHGVRPNAMGRHTWNTESWWVS
jgi:peptide/nickel transport system substrate-binding protein